MLINSVDSPQFTIVLTKPECPAQIRTPNKFRTNHGLNWCKQHAVDVHAEFCAAKQLLS